MNNTKRNTGNLFEQYGFAKPTVTEQVISTAFPENPPPAFSKPATPAPTYGGLFSKL